jgi:hypothetical protein
MFAIFKIFNKVLVKVVIMLYVPSVVCISVREYLQAFFDSIMVGYE